jgi:hypothetical protein
MSNKLNLGHGLCINAEHNGLLGIVEDQISSLIKKEPISSVYHVEHTPFAR